MNISNENKSNNLDCTNPDTKISENNNFCPACGQILTFQALFCRQCGQHVGVSGVSHTKPQLQSKKTYTSSEIILQTTLHRNVCEALATVQKVYLLVEVLPTGATSSNRMPLNLGLVLDRSGSMAGTKIENLKEAVKLALEQMNTQDVISLVLFDDKVDVLIPSQLLTDVTRLQSQVTQITDRGGTCIAKGLRKGLDEIQNGITPDRVNCMLLLTDGETYGDEEQCKEIALECGESGIPVSAFGLGDEWNSELLDTIAINSGGQSDYLETPDKIWQNFQRVIQGKQDTVATNVNLTLRVAPGVTPVAAWHVLPQISQLDSRSLSDRDFQHTLGNLERSTGQSVLVELVVQPKPAGTSRIAQLDLSYDLPAVGLIGEHMQQDIQLTLTNDLNQVGAFSVKIMNLLEKVSVFKLQIRALKEAQAGNIVYATQKLRAAATRLLDLDEAELAWVAHQEASNLELNGQMSAAGAKKFQYGTRKLG